MKTARWCGLVRAFGCRHGPGIFASARFGSRRIGRLLWVFRAKRNSLRYPAVGTSVMEFAPQDFRETQDLWPQPGTDFAMMKMIKEMFDPASAC